MVKYKVSNEQVSSTLNKESIVLNFEKGMYFSLDGVGTFVWDLLKENPLSFDEIVNMVIDNFDVNEDTCRNDLDALFNELKKVNLICETE